MGQMSTLERIRLGWLVGTAIGTAFMAANLKEAATDLWALNQSGRRTIEALQIQARGSVWDQALKMVAMSSLFAIGLVSRPGARQSQGRRYMVSVGLMLLNGGCLVVLSWMQNRRRHLISRALRLRSREHGPTRT